MEVQKVDIGKLEFPIATVKVRISIRVTVRGWVFGTVMLHVLERRPGEVQPSDTFDLMHVNPPAQSSYQKSISFRSTYRRI